MKTTKLNLKFTDPDTIAWGSIEENTWDLATFGKDEQGFFFESAFTCGSSYPTLQSAIADFVKINEEFANSNYQDLEVSEFVFGPNYDKLATREKRIDDIGQVKVVFLDKVSTLRI